MLKFDLGKIYMSDGIDNAIKKNKDYIKELLNCFEKYLQCNWGDLENYDILANENALKNGNRILGSYSTTKGKVFLITELKRNMTTILFANEY